MTSVQDNIARARSPSSPARAAASANLRRATWPRAAPGGARGAPLPTGSTRWSPRSARPAAKPLPWPPTWRNAPIWKSSPHATVEAFGRIDVLVNNAGVMPLSPLEKLLVDEVGPHHRRQHQGRALRHRRGAAAHAGAGQRAHPERRVDRGASRCSRRSARSTAPPSMRCAPSPKGLRV